MTNRANRTVKSVTITNPYAVKYWLRRAKEGEHLVGLELVWAELVAPDGWLKTFLMWLKAPLCWVLDHDMDGHGSCRRCLYMEE